MRELPPQRQLPVQGTWLTVWLAAVMLSTRDATPDTMAKHRLRHDSMHACADSAAAVRAPAHLVNGLIAGSVPQLPRPVSRDQQQGRAALGSFHDSWQQVCDCSAR